MVGMTVYMLYVYMCPSRWGKGEQFFPGPVTFEGLLSLGNIKYTTARYFKKQHSKNFLNGPHENAFPGFAVALNVRAVCYNYGAELMGDAAEVSAALERLDARRKHRQYSATSSVLSSASATQCSTTAPNTKPTCVRSAQAWSQHGSATAVGKESTTKLDGDSADSKQDPHQIRCRTSAVRRRGPTEDCDVDSTESRVCQRSSEAGSRRSDHHQPGGGGTSYYESQRSMIEQSRALLEQSKAKHHALVAQAHSMQKRLRTHQLSDPSAPLVGQESDSRTVGLAPKPPTAPAAERKPMSTFRTQRLARYNNNNNCYYY